MQKATFYDAKGNLSCFKRIAIVVHPQICWMFICKKRKLP